jgi:hypothetical protein
MILILHSKMKYSRRRAEFLTAMGGKDPVEKKNIHTPQYRISGQILVEGKQ